MTVALTVLLFVVVLVLLIVVHEFGHFVVAKLSGMRVDEFGIGYPPRIWGFRKGETIYSINWLPFGGFVSIYGEDQENGDEDMAESARAFSARPRILQALVLVAGILMNLLFAYVLITATLAIGLPQALTPDEAARATDTKLAIATILPNSPAEEAGLKEGDFIRDVVAPGQTFSSIDPDSFVAFIGSDTSAAPLTFDITRGGKDLSLTATPRAGVLPGDPTRVGLGVGVAPVGTVPVSLLHAPIQGAVLTWELIKETAIGLVTFFASLVTFKADLSQVSGPVGIASAVGDAAHQGIAMLFSITALISINLALLNVLPIPALDGGRLLFVIIESVLRRPIKPSVARAINAVGFMLLILLMVLVTGHDIFKLVT